MSEPWRLRLADRHFVVFKVSGAQTLDVLRLLHDSMDLEKHLPPTNDNPH